MPNSISLKKSIKLLRKKSVKRLKIKNINILNKTNWSFNVEKENLFYVKKRISKKINTSAFKRKKINLKRGFSFKIIRKKVSKRVLKLRKKLKSLNLKRKRKTFGLLSRNALNNLFCKKVTSLKLSYLLKKMLRNLFFLYKHQIIKNSNSIENDETLDDFTSRLDTIKELLIFKNRRLSLFKILYRILYFQPKLKRKIHFALQRWFLRFLFKNKKCFEVHQELICNIFKTYSLESRTSGSRRSTLFKKKVFVKKAVFKIKSKIKNKKFLLYKKLIGLLLKKGEKTKATKLVEKAFYLVSKKLKIRPNFILSKLLNKLKTSVELKKIRVRRSFHLVPFPVNLNRKIYLVAKWLLLAVKKSKFRNTEVKLSNEILKVLSKKNSIPYKLKKSNMFESVKNRSNLHFRW